MRKGASYGFVAMGEPNVHESVNQVVYKVLYHLSQDTCQWVTGSQAKEGTGAFPGRTAQV